MKGQEESVIKKNTSFKIDNSLKKYEGLPLFQRKLDEANEVLKRAGIPKTDIYKKND